MERIPVFKEYRLIEKNESEINGAWKGAHILLFFLAFVFGSFCTFCFHMLMYLFDEQCVLFPKILSLGSVKHSIIYEFIPPDKDLPVDFLSTQWVDKSACYLPTYVPLVSGIFGLVWTTMFLMCSSGSRTHTGLQRPWRVLPSVFIFSVTMGVICIYSSTVTHSGLQELCLKLGEITGSSTCTYTINVATLAYERRIRGVYQATRLTIYSAWMHTACWLFSALLTLTRVLLAVDFQLVCVRAELRANIDKMLEKHEKHIRTISPDLWLRFEDDVDTSSSVIPKRDAKLLYSHTEDKSLTGSIDFLTHDDKKTNILYFSKRLPEITSELSLVPEERHKLARISAYQSVPRDKKFIVKIIYDLIDKIELPKHESKDIIYTNYTTSSMKIDDKSQPIARQFGQEQITSKTPESLLCGKAYEYVSIDLNEAEEIAKEITRILIESLNRRLLDLPIHGERQQRDQSVNELTHTSYDATLNILPEIDKSQEQHMVKNIANKDSQSKVIKKSNIKSIGTQTDTKIKQEDGTNNIQIRQSKSTYDSENFLSSTENAQEYDKEAQTITKEKQD